jgi:hypothetical protein
MSSHENPMKSLREYGDDNPGRRSMARNSDSVGRREFLQTSALAAVAGAATLSWPRQVQPAGDLDAISAEIAKRHDESVKRLQSWIRQPSIAAENRGMSEGCEFTMNMLRDAGFGQVSRVSTDGQPGIFATLDAGATAHRRPLLHVRRKAG